MDRPRRYLAVGTLLLLLGSILAAGCGDYEPNHDVVFIKLDPWGDPEWNVTIDGGFDDTAWNFVQTGDGGFAIASGAAGERFGAKHPGVIRLTQEGRTLWTASIPDPYTDEGTAILENRAGDLLVGTYHGNIWKLDRNGKVLWERPLQTDTVWAIAEKGEGTYLVPGMRYNGSNYLPVVTCFDDQGNITWQKEYGGYQYGVADAVLVRGEGSHYIVAGYMDPSVVHDPVNTSLHTFLAGLKENGDLIWWKDLGSPFIFRPLMRNVEGGFSLLFGRSYFTGDGKYIIESGEAFYDGEGVLQRSHVVGRAEVAQWGRDGRYLLAGYPEPGIPDRYERFQAPSGSRFEPLHLMVLDAGGNRILDTDIRRPVTTTVRSLLQTSDGGYAILAERDNQ